MILEVDHSELRGLAAAINAYCTLQDEQMRLADAEVQTMLSSGWHGMDADEFSRQWSGVNADGSTTVKFRESLQNFAQALEACADEYRSAQVDTINAAGLLMRLAGR